MIKLIQTCDAGGDCCAPYDVELDRQYTFGELLDKILSRREWGEISFAGYRFSYNGDKISPNPDSLRNCLVTEAKAYGGWSRMDYTIK